MSAPPVMRTLGLDLADAGLGAALSGAAGAAPQPLVVPDQQGARDWPGYACSDGKSVTLGRAAEDLWFVHPRRIDLQFWARLGHDPSPLQVNGKSLSSSALAFLFLREFLTRAEPVAGQPERVVLAVPGAYLRDPAIEEERVGLLLGLAHELRLPLVAVVDAGLAALCDPRGPGCDPSLPVVLVDAGLTGADLTLFLPRGGALTRAAQLHLPQAGLAALQRQLTAALGNRFLRHTAFDILTDGRVEQVFFRQVHDFLGGDAPEHRFVISTGARTYEMNAKREQLAVDAPAAAAAIAQGLQDLLARQPGAPATPGTVALTDRAARIPGLEARLRAVTPARVLRLPGHAAAVGAALLGQTAADPRRGLAPAGSAIQRWRTGERSHPPRCGRPRPPFAPAAPPHLRTTGRQSGPSPPPPNRLPGLDLGVRRRALASRRGGRRGTDGPIVGRRPPRAGFGRRKDRTAAGALPPAHRRTGLNWHGPASSRCRNWPGNEGRRRSSVSPSSTASAAASGPCC